jgi:hypothetical protein
MARSNFMKEWSKPVPSEPCHQEQDQAGSADLALPDWRGQRTAPSTLSIDSMLSYCETQLIYLRSSPARSRERRGGGCEHEFVL